jgi:uncharacterized protein (DUF58 family)
MRGYGSTTRTARIARAGTGELRRWFLSLARRPPVDSGGAARLGRRYIYILPTGIGVLFGGVLTLMLVGSLNYQNNLALLLTFLMVSIALVSMIHTWLNLLDLRIAVRAESPVFAGQDAAFSVTMEDDRTRARGDLVIHMGRCETRPIHLDPDASCSVRIAVPTVRRGGIAGDGISIDTRYPLGLFRAWSYPGTDARVTIYPRPAERSPTPVPVPAVKSSDQGELGVGADDFVGPRDYRPGDPPRRLDWKALARERGLVVKQFGGDRAAQVWIDWDRLPPADTELRLSLLCRQILDTAEQGLSYGLRLAGETVPMGQGEIQKHRCLERLADFGHGYDESRA